MRRIVKVLVVLIITINTIVNTSNFASASEVWLWPVEGCYKITSEWGWRTINGVSKLHAGIDISAGTGTPVRAVQDGWLFPYDHGCTGSHLQKTCTKNDCTAGAEGNWIMIRHDTTNNLYTAYKHLSKLRITKEGRVYKGDIIGYVGNTGDSDGSHLHFEMGPEAYYKNTINPLKNNYAIVDKNNPNPGNTPHNCSGGKFLWYWTAHPHYNCYACASCGKEWANKNETNYIASCSECNPPKQSASTTVSKWVTCKTKIKISAGSPKTWIYRIPESDTVSNKTWDYFSTRIDDINFTSEKYAVLSNGRTRYQVNVSANGETITAYINSTDVQVVNKYHTASSTNFDTSHPHKKYTLCECGQKTYTGETKKVNGCAECYPKVEETKSNYYTITYNANGGSDAPGSETIPDYDGASESIKISSKEPTRSGYTFLGWSTSSGASRAEYEGGDRYYIDKDTTFYAVWKKETVDNKCGNNMTWEYYKSTKTLKISGTGYMYDYDNRSRPWENIKNDVESIEIEDGIRDIGNCAFKDFENLEWLELPDSILAIGESAFSNCDNVEVWYDGTQDEFYETDMESGNSAIRYDVTYNYYTVSFTNLKGNKISEQKVKKNSRAKQPSNISKDGYVFIGWYVNGEEYDFDDKVNKDIIISAEWQEENLIIGTSNSDKIILTIGKKEANVFGKTRINDVAPVTRNGRTMLPARFVAEALGATVEWNEANETVRITSNGYCIELIIGRTDVSLYKYEYDGNGYNIMDIEFYTLDSCPFIENSRTYLPIRFIAEQLGATVDWDEYNQQVIITKN